MFLRIQGHMISFFTIRINNKYLGCFFKIIYESISHCLGTFKNTIVFGGFFLRKPPIDKQ